MGQGRIRISCSSVSLMTSPAVAVEGKLTVCLMEGF